MTDRKTTSTRLCALLALALVAALCTPQAFATGTPKPEPAPTSSAVSTSSAISSAKAGASSAVDLSLMNSATGGAGGVGSVQEGHTYVLPSPAAAAPLPPGLCPMGDSASYSIAWGFVSWSLSSTRTEMQCLDKVLSMLRDTAPKPVVVNYLQPPVPEPVKADYSLPAVKAVACEKPAKPKAPKKTAAAKPADGSCKRY